MQKMQCEMCGSTDIIKQDGVFVCQYCGCKYTLEEAKKLLGTVRIDNTERLANLYQLARRAKDENNTALAAKYYNQIVVENPDDWEAVFYSTYYTAMECKIGEIATAATTISNNFPTVFNLIVENVEEEKQPSIFAEITPRIAIVTQILMNGAIEHYNAHTKASGIYSETSTRTTAVIYMVENFADHLVKYFKHNPGAAASTYKFALDVKKRSRHINDLPNGWEESIEEKILKLSPQYQDVIDLRESKARLSTLENHLAELEKDKKEFTPLGLKFFYILILITGILLICTVFMGGLAFFTFLLGLFLAFVSGGLLWITPEGNRKAKEAEEHIPAVEKEIEELKKKIAELEEEIMVTE